MWLVILPFNWPPAQTDGTLVPCQAAGKMPIVKTSEQAPLTAMGTVEITQSVFPPDAVQAIPAPGPEMLQALKKHPRVKMASLSGSATAGAKVERTAAVHIMPNISLSLGEENAFVLCGICRF